MKIKSGLVWKTSSHELIGFSADVESFDQIVYDFLQENETDKLATYVNQWMYISIDGLSFPCSFYYNASNLNAQTLFNQFQQVVEACEAVGRPVHAINFDAGGSNSSLLSAFRDWENIPDNEVWLSEEFMSFVHPVDPSRRVYAFFCSTHGLKNLRNALFNSQERKLQEWN